MLLVCAVSPRLPPQRVAIPGAAFVASIAYSIYLSHKLAVHLVENFCQAHAIDPTSMLALGLWLALVAAVGVLLFFAGRCC